MDALKIRKAIIVGFDWGTRTQTSWQRSGLNAASRLQAIHARLQQTHLAGCVHQSGYFDDATHHHTAASFNNPDHVASLKKNSHGLQYIDPPERVIEIPLRSVWRNFAVSPTLEMYRQKHPVGGEAEFGCRPMISPTFGLHRSGAEAMYE
jgi:hypothetical protein